MSARMQLMKDQFENRIAGTQICVKELNRIIKEMSKEILLDTPFNNDNNKKYHSIYMFIRNMVNIFKTYTCCPI